MLNFHYDFDEFIIYPEKIEKLSTSNIESEPAYNEYEEKTSEKESEKKEKIQRKHKIQPNGISRNQNNEDSSGGHSEHTKQQGK